MPVTGSARDRAVSTSVLLRACDSGGSMAERTQYEELARQLTAVGAVRRDIQRVLPSDCPAGPTTVLTLLGRYGDMRMGKLAELLAVDMSVTSRHVAYVAARGWIDRLPDH